MSDDCFETCQGHDIGDGITSGGRVQHMRDPYRPASSPRPAGSESEWPCPRCATPYPGPCERPLCARRPAAPDTTGGELREQMWLAAEAAIAAYMLSGSSSLGTRWSASDAEDLGAYAVDAVLALPALRDLLAERDTLAAQVRAVPVAVRRAVEAAEVSLAHGLPIDVPEFVAGLRRALGTPTTGGGE